MHRTIISIKKRHAWQHAYTNGCKDFSGSREREQSISGTFVRLNALDYKRAEQSDRFIQFLIGYKLSENKRVAVECEQTSCGCI